MYIPNEREVEWMRTIAGLRADEKLTQEDLANELGVSTQTIKNWEQIGRASCRERV